MIWISTQRNKRAFSFFQLEIAKSTIPEYTNGALLYIPKWMYECVLRSKGLKAMKTKFWRSSQCVAMLRTRAATLATLHVYPKAKHKIYVKPIDKFCHRVYNLNIIV